VRLLAADATRLGRSPIRFDFVFLDPPWHSGLATAALESAQSGGWIAAHARIIVELAAREAFTPPAGLVLEDERRYGLTRLIFLRPDQGLGEAR
jgi:16S rRNA (guanine966-N2)-methyltransferase